MHDRRAGRAPLSRSAIATLLASAAVGLAGLLPGSAGAGDPVALLAWLTLVAPAAGALVGARGVRLLPFGLAVPGLWTLFLVWSDLLSARDLAAPAWAACVVAGLFALGMGLGRLLDRWPWALAGGLVLVGLVLSGLSVQGGLAEEDASWGREHPRLAALLIDLSPLVLAFECAGWDWTHAHPEVYARSGVEWFPRRPYDGSLAGPAVLLVGCSFATLAARRVRRRRSAGTRRR